MGNSDRAGSIGRSGRAGRVPSARIEDNAARRPALCAGANCNRSSGNAAHQVSFGSQLLEDVDHHAARYPMLSSKVAGGGQAHAALEPAREHRTAQLVI